MKSAATTLGHPFRWLGLIIVAALAIAAAFFFLPRQRESVRPPLNERSRGELILKDNRLFEPDSVTPFSGIVFTKYDGGELQSRSTVSNGWLQGRSEGWHTNGQQQVAEHFEAGTSHGLRTKWHSNGQKLSEVTIVSGQLQGLYRSWHENGERAEEVELKDGQPDGLSKAWFPSGFQKTQVTLRDGKVMEQKFWKDGEFKEAAITGPDPFARN